MRRRLAVRLVAVVLAAATACPFVPGVASAQVDDEASDLLERVAGAERASYRARQVVVYFGPKQSAAVLDVQSSEEGRFVRAESGRDVTRLWTPPRVGAVDGEDMSKHDGDVTQMSVSPRDVLAKYVIDVGARKELLGVKLVPLTLTRREDYVLAERWWIHAKTGVIYRRELFDAAGELVGLTSLIEMRWGKPGPSESVGPDADDAPAVHTVDAPSAPRRLVGGYRFWRAYALDVDDRAADHWVYSDGLHALSVFRTPGRMRVPEGFAPRDGGGHRVWAGPGPGTFAWEGDGSTFVVVAEEAALDVEELIEPFPKGGPSLWARLGSGWSRLFGALARLFS